MLQIPGIIIIIMVCEIDLSNKPEPNVQWIEIAQKQTFSLLLFSSFAGAFLKSG